MCTNIRHNGEGQSHDQGQFQGQGQGQGQDQRYLTLRGLLDAPFSYKVLNKLTKFFLALILLCGQ